MHGSGWVRGATDRRDALGERRYRQEGRTCAARVGGVNVSGVWVPTGSPIAALGAHLQALLACLLLLLPLLARATRAAVLHELAAGAFAALLAGEPLDKSRSGDALHSGWRISGCRLRLESVASPGSKVGVGWKCKWPRMLRVLHSPVSACLSRRARRTAAELARCHLHRRILRGGGARSRVAALGS